MKILKLRPWLATGKAWSAMAGHGQRLADHGCHGPPLPSLQGHRPPLPAMAGHGLSLPAMVRQRLALGTRPGLGHGCSHVAPRAPMGAPYGGHMGPHGASCMGPPAGLYPFSPANSSLLQGRPKVVPDPNPWPAMAGHGVWASKLHRTTGLLAMARNGWPMVFGLSRPMAQTPWPVMAGHGVWARKFHRTTGLLVMARHGWPLIIAVSAGDRD